MAQDRGQWQALVNYHGVSFNSECNNSKDNYFSNIVMIHVFVLKVTKHI
jgi:hypothetical protein